MHITNWLFKILKFCIRVTLQVIRDIDGIFTWATTFWHPKDTIIGQCKKRGICCQNLAIGVSKTINKNKPLLAIANWWYEFVYNFKLKGLYKTDQILLYSCNYLVKGKCSIYWRRPLICREYPRKKRIGQTTIPGCGYTIKKSTMI
ncbi:MAG: hypothetical protein VW397_02460 [Candidatus Margulisiibacteriota bacterium]